MLSLLVSCANPGDTTGDGGNEPDTGENNNGEEDVAELVDVRELGYIVVCNMTDTGAFNFAQNIVTAVKDKYDAVIDRKPQTAPLKQYEIVVGEISSRPESSDIALEVESATTSRVGVGVMRMVGDKLIVNASTTVAYTMLSDKLVEFMKDESFEIPKDLDYIVYYDILIYDETSKIVTYEKDALAQVAYPGRIKLNGSPISDFKTNTYRYELETNFAIGYPTVSADLGVTGAKIEITQPTAENNGVATVTSTSPDGKQSATYVINFTMLDYYAVSSEIVIKDGKRGTVTIVLDDGQINTARIVSEISASYPSIKASFAIPTHTLATLEVDTATNTYVIDENGRYVYTKKDAAWDFWTEFLKDTRFEAMSHSHTHSYWGDDDEGGSFEYTKNDGTVATSEYFPKGNVTKELVASKQIIEDLGQRSLIFVKPGVGATLSDYYFKMVESGLYFIGARGAVTVPRYPRRMLNYLTAYDPFNVKAYMIQHYNINPEVTTESTEEECVAGDITYWKNYIDAAISEGAWAAFGLHNIVEDNYPSTRSGHYIYRTQADKLFSYIESHSSDLWMASYTDATIYYNQWSSASVYANVYSDGSIKINLTHQEVGDCYDMAMTVKVAVPSDWTACEVNGAAVEINTDEKNNKFIYVDVTPNVELTVEKVEN